MDEVTQVLKKFNSEKCECGRILDRGDIAWNTGCTEYGTGYSVLEVICQSCDEEIKIIHTWYEVDCFEEFLTELEDCWED